MNKLVLLTTTAASVCVLSACQRDYGFMPVEIDSHYTFDEKTREFNTKGGFSVTLPSTPRSDDKYDLGFTNTHQCIACDYPDATYFMGKGSVQVIYGVAESSYPKFAYSGLDIIKSGLKGAAETSRSQVSTIDGYPYADSEGTTSRGYYRARCYFDKERMMMFMQVIEGNREKVYSKESDEFFKSFKLRPYSKS